MCQRRGARLVSRSVPLESGVVHIGARTGTQIATHRSRADHPCSSPAPQQRPIRPTPLRPGPPRPRPPGSDSVIRLRSRLAFPGATHRRFHRRPRSSAGSVHRGSQCPPSLLIVFGAPSRHHTLLRTPPELPWHGCGLVPNRAHQQRPPAHLTRRAVDSHSFAVLATDAHG